MSLDECAEVRGLFNACKGKWKQFWLPSWQRDVVVTAAISSSDDYLTIEDIDYSASWSASHIIGKYLFILLPDGTEIYRKVVGWPTDTRLNLDATIGQDIAVESVGFILVSFLFPARFEIDEGELEYFRPTVATTRFRMTTLHDENMTTTTV